MLWLGIDVGGTKTAVAIGDREGSFAARERWPTPLSGDPARDLRDLAGRVRDLAQRQGLDWGAVQGAGISVPGPLDPEAGVVLSPPNLPGWDRAPVRAVLEEELGLPVALENDANAAALAEWRFGAGRGTRDFVYLTMSTGIGGGLVLGGRIQRGVLASAGEVGHVPVVWDGEPCFCGQRGCLEAYIGGASWAQRLSRVTPADSAVARLAAEEGRDPRPEHVLGAAREGDAFALAEVERFNHYLAWGICQVVFTVAPEMIALGTIVAAAGEELCLTPVRERVRARIWPHLAEHLRLEPTQLGADLPDYAGLGVALHAHDEDAG